MNWLKKIFKKKTSRKVLNQLIETYRDDLFDCIMELPEGELRAAMVKKYPTYYFRHLIKKYGGSPYEGLWDFLMKQEQPVKSKQFHFFEQSGMISTDKPTGESVIVTIKPENYYGADKE